MLLSLLKLFILSDFFSFILASFYSYDIETANGEIQSLKKFEGKVSLVVNVASYCGYTYQYRELVQLKNEFGDDLNILAFPCNQFGEQEPEEVHTIVQKMREKFQINFDIYGKVDVHGDNVPNAWKYLIDKSKTEPRWNFYKYLISSDGQVLGAWGSRVEITHLKPYIAEAIKTKPKTQGSYDEL